MRKELPGIALASLTFAVTKKEIRENRNPGRLECAPKYDGMPITVVNDGEPYFTPQEIRIARDSFETEYNGAYIASIEKGMEIKLPEKYMSSYKDMIKDHLREVGGHVFLRTTPYVSGNESKGMLLEALSVEDRGKSLKINVFFHNVKGESLGSRIRRMSDINLAELFKALRAKSCSELMGLTEEETFSRCVTFNKDCNACLVRWIQKAAQ